MCGHIAAARPRPAGMASIALETCGWTLPANDCAMLHGGGPGKLPGECTYYVEPAKRKGGAEHSAPIAKSVVGLVYFLAVT